MSTNVIDRYVDLRRQAAAIEVELESLKESVANQLRRQNNIARYDDYELRLSTHTAWSYSSEVDTMQEQLNQTKREERQSGKAHVLAKRDMLVLKSLRSNSWQAREAPDNAEWLAE